MIEHLWNAATRLTPEIVSLRHELHTHPEIRFEEHWTSDRISRYLAEYGVPHTRGHAQGTGIVGTIEGDQSGPTVLLRADMDALEIHEQTGLPYASTIPNRMHACGHDGHSACLCGVARLLNARREDLNGSVRLIFQPAEELAAGGRHIVEEGLLDGVSAAFALHAWPTLPAGTIGLRPGWMMATADSFCIEITGRGCHGAEPARGVDPIVVAAHITSALQTVVSRELDPHESGVVTIGKIEAGAVSNVIPDKAVMVGTLRTMDYAKADPMAQAIERIAVQTAKAFRADAAVTFSDARYPSLYNDPDATRFVEQTAAQVLGKDRVVALDRPCMAAEDFAFYLRETPGTFVCLGNNPNPDEEAPALHSSYFDFCDAAIPTAITLMSSLAIRYLAEHPGMAAVADGSA